MAIIKCKMCGGDIELSADKTIGTCDSCGSQMTLPKIDDEQRAAAFNRGNHFRRIGEFDKALAVYERIVQENDADAEAHWCCALCRFGIEYVEDPTTYEWVPTCHRASFDSFLEDVDYLAAVEHSDGVARRQYQKEAERIAEIQRSILATSQNEQPFDVFICYKESDENGDRTRDSAIAQDIYYQLTEQGFRVFFARITLEDKVGSQYEPYIFAALNSAKVMIVVGTKPEYMNAVWVKNEWSRFLALMKRDRSKLLLPCYRDMDPYDLPEQLSVLQAYDMSKIGFIQDLIRGVSKVLGKDKRPEPVRETVVVQSDSGTNNDALLKRGQLALEDGDWQKADSYFDRVLDSDAECAEAYVGKFLAEKQQVSLEKCIARKLESVQKTKPESKTAVDIEHARIEQAVSSYTVPGYLEENEIRGLYDFNRNYASTADAIRKWSTLARKQWNSEKMLVRAYQFAKGAYKEKLEAERTRLYEALDALVTRAEQQDQESAAEVAADYAHHLNAADQKASDLYQKAVDQKERDEVRRQAEAKKRDEEAAKKQEEDYQAACRLQNEIKTPSQASDAATAFSKLGDYKDSEARARACREKTEHLTAAMKKRKMIKVIIGVGITMLVIVAVVFMVRVVIPSGHYKAGETALSAGNYDTARAEFTAAGSYSNANERILAAYYLEAEEILAAGDYDRAREQFAKAGIYHDAAERILSIYYIEGDKLLAIGDYSAAWEAFALAGDYKDASTREQAWHYQQGVILLEQGNESEAIAAFVSAGEYSDAAERLSAIYYKRAEETLSQGNIAQAAIEFGKAADYLDAGQRSFELWSIFASRSTIAANKQTGSVNHTIGVKTDGTVMAVGNNKSGQCDVSDWSGIIAVSASEGNYTIGLKADGTVIAAGDNSEGQCNVSQWSNIVAIATGEEHTVGLRSDGTVIAIGSNSWGQCNVSQWSDIVAIAAGKCHTVGLKADGTVVAVGYDGSGQCKVAEWQDIIEVEAGNYLTVGIKKNGTLIVAGSDQDGEHAVTNWKDVTALSVGGRQTVGLKSDGTVLVIGYATAYKNEMANWKNIIAISAGYGYTIGLQADGTVVAVGSDYFGQCDVSDWRDIRIPQ